MVTTGFLSLYMYLYNVCHRAGCGTYQWTSCQHIPVRIDIHVHVHVFLCTQCLQQFTCYYYMKRDIIKLPQCPVAYNIMYNAHVHIHLDMYIKGCKHIQCTCIHVYTCTYLYSVLQSDDCLVVSTCYRPRQRNLPLD